MKNNKISQLEIDHSIYCEECHNIVSLAEINKLTYEGCTDRILKRDFRPLKIRGNKVIHTDRFYKCPVCERLLPDKVFKYISK